MSLNLLVIFLFMESSPLSDTFIILLKYHFLIFHSCELSTFVVNTSKYDFALKYCYGSQYYILKMIFLKFLSFPNLNILCRSCTYLDWSLRYDSSYLTGNSLLSRGILVPHQGILLFSFSHFMSQHFILLFYFQKRETSGCASEGD